MNTIAERIKFAMNVRNVKQVEMVQRTGITKERLVLIFLEITILKRINWN